MPTPPSHSLGGSIATWREATSVRTTTAAAAAAAAMAQQIHSGTVVPQQTNWRYSSRASFGPVAMRPKLATQRTYSPNAAGLSNVSLRSARIELAQQKSSGRFTHATSPAMPVPPIDSVQVLQRLQQLEDIIVVLLARRKTLCANERALHAYRDASNAIATPLSEATGGASDNAASLGVKWMGEDATAANAPPLRRSSAAASGGVSHELAAIIRPPTPPSAALHAVDTKIIGQFVLAQRFVERLPVGSQIVPPEWLAGLRRVILQNAVSIPSSMLVRVLSPASQIAHMCQIESTALHQQQLQQQTRPRVQQPPPVMVPIAHPRSQYVPAQQPQPQPQPQYVPTQYARQYVQQYAQHPNPPGSVFSAVTGNSRQRLNSLSNAELSAMEMLVAAATSTSSNSAAPTATP